MTPIEKLAEKHDKTKKNNDKTIDSSTQETINESQIADPRKFDVRALGKRCWSQPAVYIMYYLLYICVCVCVLQACVCAEIKWTGYCNCAEMPRRTKGAESWYCKGFMWGESDADAAADDDDEEEGNQEMI